MENTNKIGYKVGQKVCILNDVDGKPDDGTIVGIRIDNEIPIAWLFIKSDADKLNEQFDFQFGQYWRIIEHISDKLFLR